MRMKRICGSFLLTLLLGQSILGAVPTMPNVTQEMTDYSYWAALVADPQEVLADEEEIAALNQSYLDTPECYMTDFLSTPRYYNEKSLYRYIWMSAYTDASDVLSYMHYNLDGEEVSGTMIHEALANIGGEDAREIAKTRYGIVVHRTNVVALPCSLLATDGIGEVDYSFFQTSSVLVNEPVVVTVTSKDGKWYYCDTDCCSGWIASEDVAICEDKAEWLEAWDFPRSEAVVVNEGKLYLEASNVNPAVSEVVLTMGTVLRRVTEEEYDLEVLQRMPYYNYAVWLPVREEDGSYSKTIALISMTHFVSEGYLPMTSENILKVAFSKLGDRYAWGNMLLAADCAGYIREIYRCFGLILPRNITRQEAMPVYKLDVTEATVEEKKAALDTLSPGTILYFDGHEMLYIGSENGQYYVISSLHSIRDFEEYFILKIGSVAITTLEDMYRMSGLTWMEALSTILVPYIAQAPVEEIAEAQEEELEASEEAEVEVEIETVTEVVTESEIETETATEAVTEAATEATSIDEAA